MKKKIIKLTESELTNLIKRILKEDTDTSSSTPDCKKEYRNPESKTDPYKYSMDDKCQWQTKTDKWDTVNNQSSNKRIIKDWISLVGNVKANERLNKWFPNAISDCLQCQKKTHRGDKGLSDCPKTINCMPGVGNRPNICNNPKMLEMCKKLGTQVTY